MIVLVMADDGLIVGNVLCLLVVGEFGDEE